MWPKKPNLVDIFSKIKKAKGVEKKAKNHKFGLKKAKLATLMQTPVTSEIEK